MAASELRGCFAAVRGGGYNGWRGETLVSACAGGLRRMIILSTLYLIAAVIGCTILVCQFLLALVGLGHGGGDIGHHGGGGFHGDAHSGGFDGHDMGDSHAGTVAGASADHADSTHLFAVLSFRTLTAAAAFFGVTGLALQNSELPATTSFFLALCAGAGALYGMYGLLRLIAGLSSSGNERIGNALGLAATVYVPIPATGKGAGKVQLSMQNRIVEYQAVTDDAEPLKTGETVEVVGIKNSDTVRVRRTSRIVEQQPATC